MHIPKFYCAKYSGGEDGCQEQCFNCVADVGEQRKKTQQVPINDVAKITEMYEKEIKRLRDKLSRESSLLVEAQELLGSMRRSMCAHPDCEENSEFDDYADSAQELEDKIEKHISGETS